VTTFREHQSLLAINRKRRGTESKFSKKRVAKEEVRDKIEKKEWAKYRVNSPLEGRDKFLDGSIIVYLAQRTVVGWEALVARWIRAGKALA